MDPQALRRRLRRGPGGDVKSAGGVGVALEALEVRGKVRGGAITQRAIFFERLIDDVLELRRDRRVQARSGNGGAIEDGLEDDSGSVPGKGLLAGSHFVEDEPQGEEVGALVELFAAHLLGG